MDSIFHEKQDGSLCAQHCLNNLLQGEYFTPVDLSSIAQQLDEEERLRMAEGDTGSHEYRAFLQQPSGNMDDSGFFSIQVISSALGKVWGLELVLFNSPEYQSQMIEPTDERAFICNYKEHWFTVRKLGQQWFNLNSLLSGPELISDTYLALFLAQLQQEGYSIFVILGKLPECDADQILGMVRVQQQQRPRLIGELQGGSRSSSSSNGDGGGLSSYGGSRPPPSFSSLPAWASGGMEMDDGPMEERFQFWRAMQLSRQAMDEEDEDADLRQAIELSMRGGGGGFGGGGCAAAASKSSVESNVGNVKSGRCEKATSASSALSATSSTVGTGRVISEGTQTEIPAAEELRRKRQAYFDRPSNQQQQQQPRQAERDASGSSSSSAGSGLGSQRCDRDKSPAKNKPYRQ